ncbi:response regulator transcription factor [Arcobacteraceae bacterium]|nr:response regulator transcription factor [Arcobacteraceae bacterium]
MKILVLEDNITLCNFIKESLVKEGYLVDTFSDGEEALEVLNNGYSCFILDINVPSIDGISILDTIRVYSKNTPVIIISANHDLEKIKASYELGCDDYLKKPFLMYELIQKVKKLCDTKDTVINFTNGFMYDFKNRHMTNDNQDVKLAKKEILFLELLCKSNTRIFTFEEIEDYVWEGEPTSLTNIRALVKRLRKKIPENSIIIVKGIGYKLNI